MDFLDKAKICYRISPERRSEVFAKIFELHQMLAQLYMLWAIQNEVEQCKSGARVGYGLPGLSVKLRENRSIATYLVCEPNNVVWGLNIVPVWKVVLSPSRKENKAIYWTSNESLMAISRRFVEQSKKVH